MGKLKVVTFRTNPTLWRKFGEVIEGLKKAGLLKSNESKATILNLFMDSYIENNKPLTATQSEEM